MKAITINSTIYTYTSIESYWKQRDKPFILREGTMNYHLLPAQEHYLDGWRDLVEPTVGQNQKRGNTVYFDEQNDRYTYNVVNLTPEEIEQRNQQALDSDAAATKLANDIANGQVMYQRFFAYLQRQFNSGNLTAAQAKNSAMLLWNPLLPINYGQFLVAQLNLNALVPPVNAKELAILNLAKQQINDYLTNN